jgi:FkbM family methyltransferase
VQVELGPLTHRDGHTGFLSRALWRMTDIRFTSALGKFLRSPLRLIPSGAEMRIFSGPAKGFRWIAGSCNATCWMGVYEYQKQQVFRRIVKPGQVVFDLGANAGFYSLLASRLVGHGGRVVAFEPARRNIEYLRRHLGLNRITNCDVIEAAVSSHDGKVFFDVSTLPVTGHISVNRTESGYEVAAVTLDKLVHEGLIPEPDVIKCDVEGGEYEALSGALVTLRKRRPVILLATHGLEIHGRCRKLLDDLRYRVEPLSREHNLENADELLAYPR